MAESGSNVNMDVVGDEQTESARDKRETTSGGSMSIEKGMLGYGLKVVTPQTVIKQKTLQHYLLFNKRNGWSATAAPAAGVDEKTLPHFNAQVYQMWPTKSEELKVFQ